MEGSVSLNKEFGEEGSPFQRQFAHDVLHGLSMPVKRLPSKYLYDDTGSQLFSRIMDLDEYYPARCELEIFRSNKSAIADIFGNSPLNVVELGAGDGKKTRVLINELLGRQNNFTYVPIDISRAAVNEISDRFCRHFPELCINGITSDYFAGLKWLSHQNHCRNVVLFLGSSIGNFSPQGREAFLTNLRRSINTGDKVLIGFDLVKDIYVITRAYNDAHGVTAAFNKNILHRINRELDADFNLDKFRFYSTWDVFSRAVQSYLISSCSQQVYIGKLGMHFTFAPWEAIHTESSHKFTRDQIKRLAAKSGFAVEDAFSDKEDYFADCLWRAV